MKKLLFLFIASTLLFSCEPDETESPDPIIGKWQLSSFTIDGNEVATDCMKKSTMNFSEDFTVIITASQDDGNGTCESEIENTTWSNTGDSNYQVLNDGETFNEKINFSNNNTVFTNTNIDEEDGEILTLVYNKI
jgi:hypothetical protein